MRYLLVLLPLVLGVGAASPGESRPADAKRITEARPVGKAVSCVPINQIRSTHVLSDAIIDFELYGGHTLRNTLPQQCPSLSSERAFMYSTSLSQLCSTDIITVIHQGLPMGEPNLSPIRGIGPVIPGPWRGASCGLGQFQPVEFPPRH